MNITDAELRLYLDPEELQDHWLEQPELYWRYAKRVPDLMNKMLMAKHDMDIEIARVRLDIRGNPEKFGQAKLTEATVDEVCRVQESVILANTKFLSLKVLFEEAKTAVEALEHRRSALKHVQEILSKTWHFDVPEREGEI